MCNPNSLLLRTVICLAGYCYIWFPIVQLIGFHLGENFPTQLGENATCLVTGAHANGLVTIIMLIQIIPRLHVWIVFVGMDGRSPSGLSVWEDSRRTAQYIATCKLISVGAAQAYWMTLRLDLNTDWRNLLNIVFEEMWLVSAWGEV